MRVMCAVEGAEVEWRESCLQAQAEGRTEIHSRAGYTTEFAAGAKGREC